MPLFEFECTKCDYEFEDLISYREIGKIKCPKCDSIVKKKISLSSFQLKGEGWSKSGYQKVGESIECKEGDVCIRIPEYKDKNSGAVGLGKPEIGVLK